MMAVHVVSDPEASSPASFVVPAAHVSQVLLETYSFEAQYVISHVVLDPETSSPASFVDPASHATQTWFKTYSLTLHGTCKALF